MPVGAGALTPGPVILAILVAAAAAGAVTAGLRGAGGDGRFGGVDAVDGLGAVARVSISRDRLAVAAASALAAFLMASAASAWRAESPVDAAFEAARWAMLGAAAAIVATRSREARARWLVVSLLVAGALEALFGLGAAAAGLGPEAFAILGGRAMRAHGTFGQPNPFGAYMNMVWPLGAALALEAVAPWHRAGTPLRTGAPAPHWLVRAGLGLVGATAAGACLAGLAASWSRGAWLAAAAAAAGIAAAWCAGLLRRAPSGSQRGFNRWLLGVAWLSLAVTLALAAAAAHVPLPVPASVTARANSILEASGLLSGGSPAGDYDRASVPSASTAGKAMVGVGFTGRTGSLDPAASAASRAAANLLDVSDAEVTDATFASVERLAHWQAALAMAAEKPWLGQGPGHYALAYDRFRLPRWPDALGHAHNVYLHVLAENGLLGLAGYLFLLAALTGISLRAALDAQDGFERALGLGTFGVLCGLVVHGAFDNPWVHDMNVHVGLLAGAVLASRGQAKARRGQAEHPARATSP